MIRLAHWSFKHRRTVVAGWLLAAVVVIGMELGERKHVQLQLSSG
jgi:hypothetical protein